MTTATLTPASLDQAAAQAIIDQTLVGDRWNEITRGFQRTAPADSNSRRLLTKTVDELITEAGINAHGQRPAVDIRLPRGLGRILPDRMWRGYNSSHPASTQLLVTAKILREWGWQNRPHKLRNIRGQRCICGAICTTVELGIGTVDTAHTAAGHVLAELRSRGWNALIGDWNQAPRRTAGQAIQLVEAAAQRALNAETSRR